MDSTGKSLVLIVDDDQDTRKLLSLFLKKAGFRTLAARNAEQGLRMATASQPDIILVDVVMPGMNGYQFCSHLQTDSRLAFIPVIMVTSLESDEDRSRALAAGAVDFIQKTIITRENLTAKVREHLVTNERWRKLSTGHSESDKSNDDKSVFLKFSDYLISKMSLSGDAATIMAESGFADLYENADKAGIGSENLAQYIAGFMNLEFVPYIDPEIVELGVLPLPFCRKNSVVAAVDSEDRLSFILSNPFNSELQYMLDSVSAANGTVPRLITKPESIMAILKVNAQDIEESTVEMEIIKSDESEDIKEDIALVGGMKILDKPSDEDIQKYPIKYIADNIIYTAVIEGASDIHIEPKEDKVIVRFRIDGDMRDMFTLKRKTGSVLISRFKVIGNLDIAERRKPQDGTADAYVNSLHFKMRLATTSTPYGESLVIRLLNLNSKPMKLKELGMTEEQSDTMYDMSKQSSGAILVVGPTGSGKTTTLYSLISSIDVQNRSLITIEDPVEYRIPYANQQQVNEKAGVTFEALLKSSVRQDPDIVFFGEIRDKFSAKMAMDLSSTGHMILSTIHSSNTATTIFRLERLGILRDDIADSILAIQAQRLLKKLCPHCKKIVPITPEERKMLAPFTDDIPEEVANPVGCPKCGNIGYRGRQGVYEILRFNLDTSEIIRTGSSIPQIRDSLRKTGQFLLSDHAIMKVRSFLFSPTDIYKAVLLEELRLTGRIIKRTASKKALLEAPILESSAQRGVGQPGAPAVATFSVPVQSTDRPEKEISVSSPPEQAAETAQRKSILTVDDDPDIVAFLGSILSARGYEVTSATDGIDAMVLLNQKKFDLIISDVDMPNLDGFMLLEVINSKGIDTPVVFLTGKCDQEDEIRGYELGAQDYIRKPIHSKTLAMRIKRLLG